MKLKKKSNSTYFLLFLIFILVIFLYTLVRFYLSMSDATVRESFLGIGIDINEVDAWCNSVDGVKPCINKPAHDEGLIQRAIREPAVENGICLTEDGEWGIQLKEYGRKCISMNIVKDKQNNIQLSSIGEGAGASAGADAGAGVTVSTDNIVFGINMSRVPPIAGKNQTECIDIAILGETNKKNISPEVLDTFDHLCRNKFGEQIGLERIIDCDKSGKFISGLCSNKYFNGRKIEDNITPTCHYYTENMDEICRKHMNDSFMMATETYIGTKGGCYKENTGGTYDIDNSKVRIMCGDNAKPSETRCLPWQSPDTTFEEACKKRGGNGRIAAKIISNCPIGKRRAICEHEPITV